MEREPVEVEVGGYTYRLVASADANEVRRLADVVDHKLREMSRPGRAIDPQSILLAAIALAHELEQERSKRRQVEQRSKEMLRSVLTRIDAALEGESPAPPSTESVARPSQPSEQPDG